MRIVESGWLQKVERLDALLRGLVFTDAQGLEIPPDTAFQTWVRFTAGVRTHARTVYLIGNGASASLASHFAADLAKNGQLHTQVFSDVCLLTAVSNDIAFEQVYAEPLRRRGRPGDLLVAISSSGRSPNILNCVEVARELEMRVVTLSGFDEQNPLRQRGDLNAYIASSDYGEVETCHGAVLHCWMDMMEVPR